MTLPNPSETINDSMRGYHRIVIGFTRVAKPRQERVSPHSLKLTFLNGFFFSNENYLYLNDFNLPKSYDLFTSEIVYIYASNCLYNMNKIFLNDVLRY